MTRIGHRRPRFSRGQRRAFLQQLDGNIVGTANEGHATVARRAVDDDAAISEPSARGVNIVDRVSEMAEVAALAIARLIPIVRQFDLRIVIPRRGEEDQGETSHLVIEPAQLPEPKQIEKADGRVGVGYADHGVEIFHPGQSNAEQRQRRVRSECMPNNLFIPPIDEEPRMPGSEAELDPPPQWEPRYKGSDRLKGKVAIVTGGDSGIGRAVAALFAREGADVAIVYLGGEEDDDAGVTKKFVEKEGRKAITIAGDLGDVEFAKSVVAQTIEVFGKLDILVSVAGEQHPDTDLADITPEQLLRTNSSRTSIRCFI